MFMSFRFAPSTTGFSAALGGIVLGLMVLAPAPVRAEPKVGDKFGDWVFECQAIADGKTDCALTQTLVNKQTNQAVARFMLARNKKANEIELRTLVPLGIDIPAGVAGSIDGKSPFKFSIETCVQPGCLGVVKLKGSLQDAMKNGKALTVTFTPRGADKEVAVAGSLKGLTDGMNAAGF
jgi:invasion protein IalB